MEIVSIVGAGRWMRNGSSIRNAGEEPLNLSRWQLKDSDKNVFTFPNLTLNTNGAVQVHTKPGTNNVIDLYWSAGVPSGNQAKKRSCLIQAAVCRIPIKFLKNWLVISLESSSRHLRRNAFVVV